MAKSLGVNVTLKVLDFSWNSIGSLKDGKIGKELGEAINHENLVHLDISHNNISELDCSILGETIHCNNTLFGLHIYGNEAEIDTLGFVGKLVNVENAVANTLIFSHVEDKNEQTRRVKILQNCWICEGWSEVKFEWDGRVPSEPVFLHLECDNWKPELMIKDEVFDTYIIHRMVPPGITRYFYTVDGISRIVKHQSHTKGLVIKVYYRICNLRAWILVMVMCVILS